MDKRIIKGSVSVGPLMTNCYVLGCSVTKDAVIIDPGDDLKKIKKLIDQLNVVPKAIILTHGHYDHIGCIDDFDLPVYIHEDDAEMLFDGAKNLSSLFGDGISFAPEIIRLKDGQVVKLGKLSLKILHTPGHTRGGICISVNEILFSGDTLFCHAIGRTDLPGGSFEHIRDSIINKIMNHCSDSVEVYPGHGPATTIRQERQGNIFL